MFGGKSFAEKTVERKGRDYDDDVRELRDEICHLREAVAWLGEVGDICTFDTLRVVCRNCRCPRKPKADDETITRV